MDTYVGGSEKSVLSFNPLEERKKEKEEVRKVERDRPIEKNRGTGRKNGKFFLW